MSRRKVEQEKLVQENKALRQILGEMVYLVGGYKYEIAKSDAKDVENVQILNKATEAMFEDLKIDSVKAVESDEG